MKNLILLFMITLTFAGYSQNKKIVHQVMQPGSDFNLPSAPSADSVVIWMEDWEGEINWTSVDETNTGLKWHLSSFNAYGGSGLSWWMADTSIGSADGGYDNHWYQVLDSDSINIPASGNTSLTFYHRYKVEDPAGAEAPYTGWDGVNVRISTDGGAAWTVLQNPTPAYNVTSLYSFGDEHGEGPDVPGWGGAQLDWVLVTIDLSAYAGSTVKIRFAFASDPGYSTADDGSLFGWQIDDVSVSNNGTVLFSNNGTAEGLNPENLIESAGDLWRISTGTGLPSGTHFAEVNDTSTNSYRPNMVNSIISDYFWLPDTSDQLLFDFYLKGTFVDTDAFPAVDYWTVFFQKKGETSWRYLSNITQSAGGQNFVYSDAPLTWSRFSQSYTTGLVNLKPIAGDSIRIRITWFSDEDAPLGRALQVDNILIYTPEPVTDVEQNSALPKEYNLAQNYPNPFNPATSIKFSLPVKSVVEIKLFNILGTEIKEILNDNFSAGEHTINLNADDLTSGVYFYSIKANGENGKTFLQTKKLTLIK